MGFLLKGPLQALNLNRIGYFWVEWEIQILVVQPTNLEEIQYTITTMEQHFEGVLPEHCLIYVEKK